MLGMADSSAGQVRVGQVGLALATGLRGIADAHAHATQVSAFLGALRSTGVLSFSPLSTSFSMHPEVQAAALALQAQDWGAQFQRMTRIRFVRYVSIKVG